MKRLVWLALAAGLLAQASLPGRRDAIERGVRFIYQTASDANNLADYGEDYLWCFYSIGSTSRDPALAKMALEMGRERAAVWMRDYSALKPDARADQVADLAYGAYAAEQLGLQNPELKDQIRRAATRFTVQDFFSFDPAREPPPADIPKECDRCAHQNPRGTKICQRCGAPLRMQSRYDVWFEALLTSYFGDHYGVTLGAPYRDIIRWLPQMRPYRGHEDGANSEFYATLYSITHVIYTQDDYSRHKLAPHSLPDEFQFLKANWKEAIALKDPETMGELVDSLKAFGLKNHNPVIRMGREYLLSTQNPDGSWGDRNDKDIYQRYHPTWTAVDGLRDYKWE